MQEQDKDKCTQRDSIIVCVTKYYYGVKIEDYEINRASSMQGKMKSAYKILVKKSEGKTTFTIEKH
jgi:hypothetical protein